MRTGNKQSPALFRPPSVLRHWQNVAAAPHAGIALESALYDIIWSDKSQEYLRSFCDMYPYAREGGLSKKLRRLVQAIDPRAEEGQRALLRTARLYEVIQENQAIKPDDLIVLLGRCKDMPPSSFVRDLGAGRSGLGADVASHALSLVRTRLEVSDVMTDVQRDRLCSHGIGLATQYLDALHCAQQSGVRKITLSPRFLEFVGNQAPDEWLAEAGVRLAQLTSVHIQARLMRGDLGQPVAYLQAEGAVRLAQALRHGGSTVRQNKAAAADPSP